MKNIFNKKIFIEIKHSFRNIKKIFLFVLFLFIWTVFAAKSYAQTMKVTVVADNISLEKVIDEIEKQTDYLFVYNVNEVNRGQHVQVSARDVPVSEVLKKILDGTDISYAMEGKNIMLMSKSKEIKKEITDVKQENKITGVVIDENGEPVVGANVKVKGSSIGASTDSEGRFVLDVPANSVIEISYIGYATQEVNIGTRKEFNITLKEDQLLLEEVVVVGYGTVKRSDLVSSVTSVSLNDVKSTPTSRIDDLLQGRSTGLVIQNTSAGPDATFNIRIRGSNSISGSNQPLVVVDGFLGGNMNSINPNDIESIEILKDASATAIYGSRGANGVILIQTKSGVRQKPVIEVNSYLQISTVARKVEKMSAGQNAEYINDARAAGGLSPVFTQAEINEWYAKGGTDWFDEIFRTALQQNYQVSIRGGAERVSYYLSGNYLDNQGIVTPSQMKRASFRSNMNMDLSNKIKLGVNLNYGNTINKSITMGRDSNPIYAAERWSPTLPIYQPDGSYTLPHTSYGSTFIYNPVGLALEPVRDNKSTQFQFNAYLDYTLMKGLTVRYLYGYSLRDSENSTFTTPKVQGGSGNSSASITNGRGYMTQNTIQANYNNRFGIHNLGLTLAVEQQVEMENSATAGSQDFLTDEVLYNNLGLGNIVSVPSSSRSKRVIQSLVARAQYSLADKYLFNLALRYDGSSVFGENHKWGTFPSAAFAWRVNNENFLKHVEQISNLKLKVSYGVTGSQALSPYSTLAVLRTSSRYSNEAGSAYMTGVTFSTVANPDLRWEKTGQFDVGVELGLFRNRLRFDADYYKKRTSDLLYSVPLPRASGYQSRIENIGEVSNSGFEFTLGGDPLVGEIKWNTNLSVSFNRNKVEALASGETEVGFDRNANMDLLTGFGNTIYLIVGEPMGTIKGYQTKGTWGTAEEAEAAKYGTIPGAVKYVDQNNDGKIDLSDMVIIGNPLPKYSFGWVNSLSYRDFTLNFVLQGVQGIDLYHIQRALTESVGVTAEGTHPNIVKRWTPENQNTNVPACGTSSYNYSQDDRWMENASYVRLKTLTLGYNLPKSVLPSGISSLRAYISGVNLLTFTKFSGWDPEGRSSRGESSDLHSGLVIGSYPAQRSYTVGINLVF